MKIGKQHQVLAEEGNFLSDGLFDFYHHLGALPYFFRSGNNFCPGVLIFVVGMRRAFAGLGFVAALGAAFGLAFGAAAGAGAWACASAARKEAARTVVASKAKTRPRGQTGAAKIRKFIAENPF